MTLRRLLCATAGAAALLLPPMGVAAQTPTTPGADDTAHCIAVMQDNADELARRIKAGDASQEPALRSELVRAAALIGRVYLSGMRDAGKAKARLQEARADQQSWDAQRKATLRTACLRRADAELAGASSMQRFIVERVAQARYKRMLEAR